LWLRTNDVMGGLQAIDCCVATHEADHRSFYGRAQVEVVNDVIIEPRCVEPRARSYDDVRDAAPLFLVQGELVQGASRELWCKSFKCFHASRRVGKVAEDVEVF